jgi:DNA-binding NtrC family response regulator
VCTFRLTRAGISDIMAAPLVNRRPGPAGLVIARVRTMVNDSMGAEDVISRRRRAQVLEKLIGETPVFVAVREQLVRLAHSDATVLIAGETGTGKELIARALHYLSARAGFPFVAVNCAALPDTLLEDELFGHERGAFTDAHAARPGLLAQAERGTIFLDEVDSLTARAQGALLRVLHDRTFRALGSTVERSASVRVVAATNVDLADLVRRGGFRADLFYRLRVLCMELPALRQRRGDIPLLTRHFLMKHASPGRPAATLSPAASRALDAFDWPGNIRELENAIIRALHVAETGVIEPHHLGLAPAAGASPTAADTASLSLKESKRRVVESFEREYLARLMEQSRGNVTKAALVARKERRELGKLLKKHGLNAKDFARAT